MTATMIERTTPTALDEAYFTRAAHDLEEHYADPGHRCVRCVASWPCPKALAAAFILDMHDTGR